jgi:hypothetical protein
MDMTTFFLSGDRGDEGKDFGTLSHSQTSHFYRPIPHEGKRSMNRDHRCRLTEAQEQQLASAYRAGQTIYELADRYDYSPGGIAHLLERLGIPRRSPSDAKKLYCAKHGPYINRIYSLNEDYFAHADTPAVVRWVGFIAADGCISIRESNSQCLIVQIQERDRPHLEALAAALSFNGPIASVISKTKRGKPLFHARLSISSTKLCKDLQALGVPPRKSLILEPWAGDPAMMRHWFAGLMDGDGSIYERQTKRIWGVCLASGSRSIIESFTDYVATETGNRKNPLRDKRGTWYACYSGFNTPRALAHLFWDNLHGSTPLARKKNIADMLMAEPLSERRYVRQVRWGAISLPELEQLHTHLGSWEAVAQHFGCKLQHVKSRLDYLRSLRKAE